MKQYTLPNLPYAYDALEPYIDKETMIIHHTKHHQGYINNLNAALAQHADVVGNRDVVELIRNLSTLPGDVQTAVRNNGGGYINHSFFWELMKHNGGGEPVGSVAEAIKKQFGTFAALQEQFNACAKTVFGSGWAWLVVDAQGQLKIVGTANQDSPLTHGMQPVMGLDVWEHAYYLKYQNKRPDYINAWWHVLNWEQIEENYTLIVK